MIVDGRPVQDPGPGVKNRTIEGRKVDLRSRPPVLNVLVLLQVHALFQWKCQEGAWSVGLKEFPLDSLKSSICTK